MGILQTLLSELETDDTLQQIRELCDQIFEEEKRNMEHLTLLPKGPNLFLALEAPGRRGTEVAFLALERESKDLYLAVLYTVQQKDIAKARGGEAAPLKRGKVWEITGEKPERILTEYAKHYKYLRGD